MRNVVSGITYFLVGGSVIILVLILVVNFKAQIFDRLDINTALKQTTEKPATDEEYPDASSGAQDNTPTYPVPTGDRINVGEAVIYDGVLELPVSGATGFASVNIEIVDSDYNLLAALSAGAAFRILKEDGAWWQIYAIIDNKDVKGWVRHNYCMINLPDVVPSIVYDNTNAYKSVFRANEEAIPEITGERLYSYSDRNDGRAWNERLQKYEYIVPVLYAMAERICKAQRNALDNGDTLVIYEGYRPAATQSRVYRAVLNLPASQKNFGSWGMSMFIAGGISNHQIGYAIDTSLAEVINKEYVVTGKYKYLQLTTYPHNMPSQIHELSIRAIEGMKDNASAQNLKKYCNDAGLESLSSEWWHFNDNYTYRGITKQSTGNYEITQCVSVAP